MLRYFVCRCVSGVHSFLARHYAASILLSLLSLLSKYSNYYLCFHNCIICLSNYYVCIILFIIYIYFCTKGGLYIFNKYISCFTLVPYYINYSVIIYKDGNLPWSVCERYRYFRPVDLIFNLNSERLALFSFRLFTRPLRCPFVLCLPQVELASLYCFMFCLNGVDV